MDDKIVNLKKFIAAVTIGTKAHLCIHDMSGFTHSQMLSIEWENSIHSKNMCNCAKTTKKGMELCLECKRLSINKAISKRSMYHGICPVGLKEIVLPIEYDSKIIGIIYIGNLVHDYKLVERKIERFSKTTGVSKKMMIDSLDTVEAFDDLERYKALAYSIQSYILLLIKHFGISREKSGHWAASLFLNYIEQYYSEDITITKVAELYHVNEQYAGRIFKQHNGMSFNMYLNNLRVEKACGILKEESKNIIDVATKVGYNNVTYFNRVFKKLIGITPTEYQNSQIVF